ncbi:MAG: hypothetical protein IJ225_00760 [Solobacterium sp.]|nr:hypothetical protein [Solobacterium sp.]
MKRILGILETIVIAAVAGWLLIIGVYALPRGRMVSNIERSRSLLETDGSYSFWASELLNTQSDNFTDWLMADTAINPGSGNLIKDAMLNCYVGWGDTDNSAEWLLRTAGGEPFYEGYEQVVYGRYWHGYLLWLKPLLLVLTLPEIRLLNMGIQLALLVIAMILLYQEAGPLACLGVGLGLIAMNPVSTILSFAFSDIYIITLVSIIVLCKNRRHLEETDHWWKVFVGIGIAVAFFDLMSYPLPSLGIPLIVYLLLHRQKFVKGLMDMTRLCLDWLVGYAGMWVLKWLIGSAFTGVNLIADGLGAVGLRSSGEVTNRNMDYLNVLKENFSAIATKPLLLLIGVAALIVIIGLLTRKLKFRRLDSTVILVAGTILFPFIWYFVIRNHSIVHVWFTHRVLSIAVTAIGVLPACLLEVSHRSHE